MNLKHTAETLARQVGYVQRNGHWYAPLGKCEGEPWYLPYYFDAALNGEQTDSLYHDDGETVDCDIFEVSAEERAAFDLLADTRYVALTYCEQGFLSLTELTYERYFQITAQQVEAQS